MPFPIHPSPTARWRVPPSQIFTPTLPPPPPTLKSFDATLFAGWNFATGLVSYWKLDETSGTRYDSFGTNHLTDTGGTTALAGVQGNCAYFQRTTLNNYLSCASNASLQMSGNTDFTIACWAQLTNALVDSSLVTKDDDAANSRDYTLDYNGAGAGAGFRFYIKGGGTYLASGVSATPGVWYFIVAWYDSSNGQCHYRLNDTTTVNSATGATGTDVSNAQFRIGAREYAGFEDYAAAFVDEVAIWKRLLTPAEITALYNSGAGTTYGAKLATLTRSPQKSLTATLSPTAAISRKLAKLLTAALSFVGAITKRITDAGFTATLSRSATLVVSKTFVRALTATLSFTGALSRRSGKALSATLSFVGTFVKTFIAGGTTFTKSFTATLFQSGGALATDNFNRANTGTLGANWTGTTGAAARFSIASNQATNNGPTVTLDSYTATSAPGDQYSKITLKTILGVSDEGPGPAVRVSTTAVTAYFAQCNTTEIRLYKVVANSFTQLGTDAAAAAVNDVIQIEANGTSITVKKNGSTIIGPITDSAIATGNWGLWCAGPSASTVAFDDWEGGAPGGGAVASLVTSLIHGGATFTKALTATLSFTGAVSRKTVKAFLATLFGGDFTTAFPATENPISQGGTWLNGLATGLDWNDIATTTGKVFGTQTVSSPNYSDSTAILTGSWPSDQTVQATVFVSATNTTTFQEVEIRLRSTMTAHSSTGYEVLWSVNPTDPYCQIVRWNGPFNNFLGIGSAVSGVGNGDVVKASVVGNVITCYINGSVACSATDSTYSSGNPGLGHYLQFQSNPIATASNYGFSSFTVLGSGGTFAALSRRAGKALAATKSFAGAYTKRIVDSGFTATLSFIGAITKRSTRALSATLSWIGNLATNFISGAHLFTQTLTATLSSTAALTRKTFHPLAATLSFVGAVAKAIRDAGFTATISFIGNLAVSKAFLKALTATLSFVGAMSAKIIATRAFTATLSFTGASARRANKALSATLSFSVVLVKKITDAGFTATLSFFGALTKRIADAGFAATLSFAGFMAASKSFLKSLTATLSFVGAINVRQIVTRAFTATLNATATLSRSTGKALSATLSAAASLAKRISRTFSAVASLSAALVKFVRDAGFTATLSFVGNLVGTAAHFFSRVFTATLSFSATLTRFRLVQRVLAASLAFSGAIQRRTGKSISATLNFSAAIRRGTRKVLRGTLAFIGFLFRGGAITVLAGWVTKALATIGISGSTTKVVRAGSQLTVVERGSGAKIQTTGSQLRVERTK